MHGVRILILGLLVQFCVAREKRSEVNDTENVEFATTNQAQISETPTPTTNKVFWENRHSLSPDQVETMRRKLKWLSKKIRLYNARMRTFCLENLKFQSVFKHCRQWQKAKLTLYHQLMKLYYGRDPRLS